MKNDNVFVQVVIGRQHVGKTTYVKSLLEDIPKEGIIVYDVQNEYSDYYNFENYLNEKNEFLGFNEFLEKIQDVKDKLIVFEEASIFFKHTSSEKIITKMLVSIHHTGNIIILNFHSLRKVPKYILEMTQHITIFKTNDSIKKATEVLEHEKYVEIFKQVNESEDKYFYQTIEIID